MVTAGQRDSDLTSVKWAQLQAEREKTTASLYSAQADMMSTIKKKAFRVIFSDISTFGAIFSDISKEKTVRHCNECLHYVKNSKSYFCI